MSTTICCRWSAWSLRRPGDALLDDLLQGFGRKFRRERSGFDAGQAEQVADDPIETFRFIDDEIEQLVASFLVLDRITAQLGRSSTDGAERVAQIV
jgi:hypothetical protein